MSRAQSAKPTATAVRPFRNQRTIGRRKRRLFAGALVLMRQLEALTPCSARAPILRRAWSYLTGQSLNYDPTGSITVIPVVMVSAFALGMRFISWPRPQESLKITSFVFKL